MENGRWKMEDGRWKTCPGEVPAKSGRSRIKHGRQSLQSAVFSSQYAVGNKQRARFKLKDKKLDDGKWKMENSKWGTKTDGKSFMRNGRRKEERQKTVNGKTCPEPALPERSFILGCKMTISNKQQTTNHKQTYLASGIRNLVITLIILLFAQCPAAFSQSIDSVINEALLNNTQLKALQSGIKSAEFKSEAADYLPPPSIAFELTQVPFRNPDPFNQALSQNLSVSQMFMLGGKLNAMKEAERKNISIAEQDYDSYRNKLIADIKSKYYEIWMNEHHMELREKNIDLLKDLLQSTQNLYTVGRAKYSDLLMIKAEIADNETKYSTLENDAAAAVYQMNSLLGRDPDNKDLEVHHAWKVDSLIYSPGELQEKLISSNPDIMRMQQMIEMNELELNVNDKERIPDLMLQGMVMRMPRGMFVTTKSPPEMMDGMGKTEYMYGIMASITLPFAPWSSGKYSAKEEELSSEISGLASEKDAMQRRMISDLKAMTEKLKSTWNQLNLYSKEVIPLYKQTLEAQLPEFRNSRISINDLISTMQMLIMKEEEEAETKMKYQMIFSEIESMVGQRLTKEKQN